MLILTAENDMLQPTVVVTDSIHLQNKYLLMEPIFTSDMVADFYQTTLYHITEYSGERNVISSEWRVDTKFRSELQI